MTPAAASRPTLIDITRRLRDDTARLRFGPPVSHVYRPLEYAWQAHREYLERFGERGARVVLLGMNPGPFGMVQTGIPFGDVELVRDWLAIEAPIEAPRRAHAKRPVQGFACRRREVSGQRFWGWAREVYGDPDGFFARFFVWNYCPLAFVEESGRNRTPDRLPAAEREQLFAPCDAALRRLVEHLSPTHVVGIGRFAFDRAAGLATDHGPRLGWAPHPSPANPSANRGWARQLEAALGALDIPID